MIFAALFIGIMVAGLVGLAVLATRTKKDYDASNEVIPGRRTAAPSSWAGSHEPEARLHRRLRDAMAALRANRDFDENPMFIDLRVELEEQALALDDRLVAAAALPAGLRDQPLAQAAEHTARIEEAVAALAGRSAADALPALKATLDSIAERTSLVGDAGNELDGLDPVPSPLDDQVLDTSPPASAPAPTSAPVEPPAPVAELEASAPAAPPEPPAVTEPPTPATASPNPAAAPSTEPPTPPASS